MSVATVIPEIWARRLTTLLNQQNVFSGLFNTNYEGEIRDYGDTVRIGTLTSDVTIRDYTRYTAIAAAERPTTTTQNLVIDQAKYWHVWYDDLDRAQAKPNVMDQVLQKAAFGMSNVLDRFCANIIANPTVKGSAAGKYQDIGSSGTKLRANNSTAIASTVKTILEGLSDLKVKMYEGNLPRGQRPWIVMAPAVFGLIEKYLVANSVIDYGGATGEALRRGLVGDVLGFNIVISEQITPGTGKINTTADRFFMPAGTNQAATLAMQIVLTEAYRSHTIIGDVMRGLMVYGGKLVEDQFLYHVDLYCDDLVG